ncbi:hypothetical protein GCM10008101_25490 [Lysobacter xinjiangensis]|uniref:DUF3098 domain-containing protein n=1 Tax=Cognatilysobacter xinjiangensis TaxID=546892 RepID=A0ABQ3C6M4_9GAMM|nr:hypothetical protein [Lysobacter xinjiangensis]GGZ70145.1 hypothetical protein GCM10008101_25490 [Lysobacter xinjiangensis]
MTPRKIIGYALVAIGFLLIILMGYGVIEPFGDLGAARDLGELMRIVAPSFLIPFAIFLAGVALARGGRRR